MSPQNTPVWGKIGLLWLIFVPLCMAIYVLAQPLAPNDLWYHLRAGAWMIQHHSFPRVAMFTPSVPAGTPYFYQSWIAEIIMYFTLKWGGLAGSQILRAVCFTSAIAIFIASAGRRAKVLLSTPGEDSFNDGARRVVLVGLFALFMCIPNTDLRPQTFSLPLFAVFAATIFAWPHFTRRQLMIRAACLTGLMAIWANTHGAFATGLILLLVFCVGETVHFRFGKSWSRYLGNRLEASHLKIAWITFLGSLVAACINPRGWGIFIYVLQLTGNAINKKYNQEWQPPNWSDGSNVAFFCCGIAILLLLALILSRQKDKNASVKNDVKSTSGMLGLRSGELLVITIFFVMGLRNVRSILWFALLFIIAGTALICRAFPAAAKNEAEVIPPAMQKMNALLVIIACCLVIPFLPRFKPLLPWPEYYQQRFASPSEVQASSELKNTPAMMLAVNTPVAAAEFLRRNPPQGLLWNDMVFGSYLVWSLYPAQGPWADPRIELRPDAFWETYLDTCHAKNNPAATLAQRGFSDVLINKEAANENKLKQNLRSSSRWKVIYEDRISLLFRQTSLKK